VTHVWFPAMNAHYALEERRCQLANKDVLDLCYRLSTHALTRTAAGWAHEQRMHNHLGTGRAAPRIFQGNIESTMQSSTRMLPGILDGLKQTGVFDSFYWMPTVSNFQGVDSILGTGS
jgi:hypothetical protein